MRALVLVVAVLVALAPARGADAQEAEALRRALEQMRQQLETVQKQYQEQIEALSQRLQRLEQQPAAPVAAPPAPAPGPVAQTPRQPTTPSAPTLLDLATPRQPFALSQRGSGQLLFDMGIAGDFVANLTQRSVEKAGSGTFAGRENRFFPREVELSLFGQVDPYARAEVRIEAGEEARGAETSVSLAEAHLTLLTLPFGTQVKLGQMRNRFGWSNDRHEHDLPWVDRPDVYRVFLGEEGLVEKGAEATWVPDFLPFYVEVLGGVFNGDNETAFGRGRLKTPLATGRVRAFFEPTDTMGLQVGASVAHGVTPERLESTLLGADAKYKYRPDGWLHPLLTFGAEAIYSMRRDERGIDLDGDGFIDLGQERTLRRFGWYGWGEVQPWRRWAFGARYDSTQYPVLPGRQWSVEPYVTFLPSEFLRFRLAYKHTDRSHRDGVDLAGNGGSARIIDELLFQASFILGAHPAHPF
jgi:hypothetical protein